MPIPDNTIHHLAHSSFALKIHGKLFIFDYHMDPEELKAGDGLHNGCIRPQEIADETVFVVTSHSHSDHFHPGIFEWKERIAGITYILSYDVPGAPENAVVMRPGKEIHMDDLAIRAYPSTDQGLAFSIYIDGRHIYFAGDNAFWNWDNDLDDDVYIRTALSKIDATQPMDIAFQVCDPRLAGLGDGGIHIFARHFKPRLLVPIHAFGDYGFNKTAQAALHQAGFNGRFWCVTGKGDKYPL